MGGMANPRIGKMAVLVSGGVDSACLVDWAARNARAVQPIYVGCGLRWERMELAALRKFLRGVNRPNVGKAAVLKLPAADIYGNHWSLTGRGVPGSRSCDRAVYLPGRNLLILSKAAVFCVGRGISRMCVGTLAANPFADATPEFFSAFSRLSSAALGRHIQILAPFRRLTKVDLLRRYSHLPLHLCFSCLRPLAGSGRACGKCNKCVEWEKARGAAC